jgi:hypothetical protein
MSADAIISYDGTPNDDDALVLGKMLARGGLTLALAYVRHYLEFDPRREDLAGWRNQVDRRAPRRAYERRRPSDRRRTCHEARCNG